MSRVSLALALVVGVFTVSCGNDNSPTTPTSPSTPTSVTETFSGTINRNGAATHTFLAGASGLITVTLTSLAPEAVTTIGVSLGTWNGTTCSVGEGFANDNAAVGAVVTGAASQAANLCARVYDVGRIPATADYEISVVHP